MRRYGEGRFEVFSAGTVPSQVNPIAIRVMKEIGLDLSAHSSKDVKDFEGQHFDHIITVCDNVKAVCPTFDGVGQRHHWPFSDPPQCVDETEEVLSEFREVRDRIHTHFKVVAESGDFR